MGKLCHDAGVAVKMEYGPSGSGAYVADVPGALVNTFHYSNAVLVRGDVIKALLSSLDAKTPCVVSIEKNGSSTGHAVMADGYGYSDNTLYVHFNMGWRSSNCNVWYNPPLFDRNINGEVVTKYDTINSVVCNISTNAARYSSIASGRVFDLSGNAVPGAAVTATCDGAAVATATTDANGIYALYLPPSESAKTYSITATLNGRGSTSVTVSASRTYSNGGTEINSNSRDNDLELGVLYAKAVNGALAYFSDEDCTLPAEIPAEGLAACKKVLFADDAEFQTLVPFTNEIAVAGVPVCLQSNVTLTADADWRAIDFDLNGKVITLMGWDLQVHKPQGTGRITSGNVLDPAGYSFASGSSYSGNLLYLGSGDGGVSARQSFTLPKARPCYFKTQTTRLSSTWGQYVSAGINAITGLMPQTSNLSGTQTWGPYTRSGLEAGTSYELQIARYNGHTYMSKFATLSPTSILCFDIPEGEEHDPSNITFGGSTPGTSDFGGIGLQIHKAGKGKLVMSTAKGDIGGNGVASAVVEEGVLVNANDTGCGAAGSRIEVMDGAQFDTHGAAGSNSVFYDFTLSGAGPDGLGAVANNTEVASAYDKAFIMRNITLATNAVIGGTQKVGLKNGNWTATTMTMGGYTVTYTNTTVYAGNMSYSGTGGIVVAPDAALSFYAHSTAAADCDVTVHGSLNQNNGGFTQVKSLVFEIGSTCWLSDSAGSGNIPETVVTEKYAPNANHTNGGNCTLTTPKVQLGDESHLETTLDLSRLEGVFDGTNTTFSAGSTVTVDLGNREFQGSVLLMAWAEMPTATFVVDDANYDRLGLMPRPEGLYIFPGKVPSFVKYDVENNCWKFFDEDVNPFSGEWTLGMDYMKALFADDAEFQALAQHTNEIAASHVTVFLQDDITLTADADWRAIDFDMNGKTITLMGNRLQVRKPQGTGRITAGNLIVNGGFEDGATGWTFGSANEKVTASGNGVSANTCKDKPFAGNHWCVLGTANDKAAATTHFTAPKEGIYYVRFRFAKYDSNYKQYKVNCGIDAVNNVAYRVDVKPYPGGKSSDVYKRTLTAGDHTFIFGRYYAYLLVDEAAVSPESHLVFDIPEGEEYEISEITLGGTQNYFFDGAGLQVHKTGKGKLTFTRANGNLAGPGATSLVVEEGLAVNACADGQAFCGEAYSTIEVCDGAQFDFNGHRYHDYHYSLAGSGPDGTGALVNTAAMSNSWTVDGSKRGMLYNVTLADDATIGGTESFGMIFYDNGAHTMTMNSNTVTYAGTEIFAGQMNYSGDGRIVVATNATLRSCTSSATAGGCDVEVRGVLGQQDGMVLSPVKSLVFVEGGKFHNLKGTPAAVTVYSSYAPNVEAGDGSTVPHPIVNLGDASHLETTLDLSRWTDTFDDSAEGSLTFQAGSTVTVDIGERTQGLGKPAFLWKDAPDETVKFKPSDAMKRRGVFVVSREDGVYFKTGFTVIIR